METVPPRVFISYSHDDEPHKNWILTLGTRLVSNGVDVILDQWDLTIGSDLPRFMEQGLTEARRVLAVCTDEYVKKANTGRGGVGYEKMILTAQLMQNIASDRIIPVVRRATSEPPVPTFLSSRLYIDFRDDCTYESKYAELLRDISWDEDQAATTARTKSIYDHTNRHRTPAVVFPGTLRFTGSVRDCDV